MKKIFLIINPDSSETIVDIARNTINCLRVRNQIVISLEILHGVSFFRFVLDMIVQKKQSKIGFIKKNGIYYYNPLYFPFMCKRSIFLKINVVFQLIYINWWLHTYYSDYKKIVWIFDPSLAYISLFFPKNYFVLYDICDYFVLPNKLNNWILELEKKYLTLKANIICVNSVILKNIYTLYSSKKIHIVPQGFDLHAIDETIVMKNILGGRKFVIGFVGGISERLDYKILYPLIKQNPQWQFVFLGPIQHEIYVQQRDFSEDLHAIFSLPNVNYVEKQKRTVVYEYIKQFDVCIIPYDIQYVFNKYCYPMKLFEYFYFGKPVIATPIEELKFFPNYVKIGRTSEEWEKHIKAVLKNTWPKTYKKEQKRLAIENSWEKKISTICHIIDMNIQKDFSTN